MYHAEVTYNIGSEREQTVEESFITVDEAVKFIQNRMLGHMAVSAWINGTRWPMTYWESMDFADKLIADTKQFNAELATIKQNYDAGYNATLCDALEALNGSLAVNMGVK